MHKKLLFIILLLHLSFGISEAQVMLTKDEIKVSFEEFTYDSLYKITSNVYDYENKINKVSYTCVAPTESESFDKETRICYTQLMRKRVRWYGMDGEFESLEPSNKFLSFYISNYQIKFFLTENAEGFHKEIDLSDVCKNCPFKNEYGYYYGMTYSIKYEEIVYNKELNMVIIPFNENRMSDDTSKCMAICIGIKEDSPSSVNSTQSGRTRKIKHYDLQGRKTTLEDSKGQIIIERQGDKSKKFINR